MSRRDFPTGSSASTVKKKDGTVHHPLVDDTRSLLWMANQNTITPHVWVSRVPNLYYPDVCVFDLDPSHDDEPEQLRATALALRDLLGEFGLRSWVKTSGSKGFHILLSLDGTVKTGDVARFAHAVGTTLVTRDPQHLTQEFSQGRPRRTHPRRHGPQRLQRDVCRRVRGARETGRAGLGAVHVGRDRAGRRRSADVLFAHHGRAHRRSRRPVGRPCSGPARAWRRDPIYRVEI